MKKKVLSAVLSILLLLAVSVAEGSVVRVDDLLVKRTPGLSVSFILSDAFTRELDEAISKGVPISFTFELELYRLDRLWAAEEVGRWTFIHAVKYDTLREEFEVTLGESGAVVRTKDEAEMKRLMSEGSSIALNPTGPIANGENCELRIKVLMRSARPEFLSQSLIFFLQSWDRDTEWRIERFVF